MLRREKALFAVLDQMEKEINAARVASEMTRQHILGRISGRQQGEGSTAGSSAGSSAPGGGGAPTIRRYDAQGNPMQ